MKKDLIINISISLISIFICTVLVFAGLEIRNFLMLKPYQKYNWKNPNTKFDSELGWSPILNRRVKCPDGWQKGILSSNSQGFRSAEIDPTKKAIIVIGDSVAFGAGVGDEDTFSYFLDKMVSDKGYQVSNLAVSGYNLEQYFLFLNRHINKFKNIKYIVLVVCTHNDLRGIGSNVLYGKRKPYFEINNNQLILKGDNIKKYCLRNILSRSLFLSRYEPCQGFIGTLLSKIAGDVVRGVSHKDDKISLIPITMIQQIYNLASIHGAKLFVVISPSRHDFVELSPFLRWFQAVFKGSINKNNNELETIDFISYIKKEDVDKVFAPNDIVHYSPEGHRLLAKTVYEHLFETVK